MSSPRLDELPSELLTHIAACCNASSALSLSATCRAIRAGAFSALVFQMILETSHEEHWSGAVLDLEAIAGRCGRDPTAWARYALADEQAYLTVYKNTTSVTIPENVLKWAPALSTVKHPFMYSTWWARRVPPADRSELPITVRYVGSWNADGGSSDGTLNPAMWCIATATLARESDSDDLVEDYRTHAFHAFSSCQSLTGHLHGLCSIIIGIRLKNRRLYALRPSRSIQNIPVLKYSSLDVGPKEALPLPFETSPDDWNRWVESQSDMLIDKVTTGTWQGYYMHGHSGELESPMNDVEFQQVPSDDEELSITSQGGWDSVGLFRVKGKFSRQDQTFHFKGSKMYHHPGDPESIRFGWNWSLKLTPFGLVGYWGMLGDEASRLGTVWLWRQD